MAAAACSSSWATDIGCVDGSSGLPACFSVLVTVRFTCGWTAADDWRLLLLLETMIAAVPLLPSLLLLLVLLLLRLKLLLLTLMGLDDASAQQATLRMALQLPLRPALVW